MNEETHLIDTSNVDTKIGIIAKEVLEEELILETFIFFYKKI